MNTVDVIFALREYFYVDLKGNIHIKSNMPEKQKEKFLKAVETEFAEIKKGNVVYGDKTIISSEGKIYYDPSGYNPTLKELLEL